MLLQEVLAFSYRPAKAFEAGTILGAMLQVRWLALCHSAAESVRAPKTRATLQLLMLLPCV